MSSVMAQSLCSLPLSVCKCALMIFQFIFNYRRSALSVFDEAGPWRDLWVLSLGIVVDFHTMVSDGSIRSDLKSKK